jgi:hypothetical protein
MGNAYEVLRVETRFFHHATIEHVFLWALGASCSAKEKASILARSTEELSTARRE